MDRRRAIFFFLLLNLLLGAPGLLRAQSEPQTDPPFSPNYLLDDSELEAYDAMSVEAIRRFLAGRGGGLATYRTIDLDGLTRDAAEVIWRASQNYRINPKFLIVLLQREQSLIENPTPGARDFDWATGYAVCDSCSTEDPAIQKFRGFATQVDRAAWRQRYYLTNPGEFDVRVGQPRTIDGLTVTPANQATANLYIYTPHLEGNRNFWLIWNRYFARHYPDGSLLREESTGNVWLLTNGRLRLISSTAALLADYDPANVVTVPVADILRYDIGAPIRFSNYSLLRSPGGTVYLLVDEVRRGISSREVFRTLGFNPDEVIDVTWGDLAAYPEGLAITDTTSPPIGELLQDRRTGGVYYLADGVRQPIWSREILKSRFLRYPIRGVDAAALERYPLGEPVKFRDGDLVVARGQTIVYVISNGQKRPIVSANVFRDLGYRWANIVATSPEALSIHPDGEPVTG